MRTQITNLRDKRIKILLSIDTDKIARAARIIRNSERIYVAGNGGSASTANHFVTDLRNRGYDAYSLVSNSSVITAIANDYDYSDVFINQLPSNLTFKDTIVLFSASGKSKNIRKVIDYAKDKCQLISIFGWNDDGEHLTINLNTETGLYEEVEDIHLIIAHIIVQLL